MPWLPAALVDAAMRGQMESRSSDGSASGAIELLVPSPTYREGRKVGGLGLPVRCSKPHSQTLTLGFRYAPKLPPAELELAVTCGQVLSVGGVSGGGSSRGTLRGTLALEVGQTRLVEVSGAWADASVEARLLLPAGLESEAEAEAEAPANATAAPAGPVVSLVSVARQGAAAKGPPSLRLTGEKQGLAQLALSMPEGGAASSCDAVVPLAVSIGGFSLACPTTSLLVGSSMLCYALATANGVEQPPIPHVITGASFAWDAEDSARAPDGFDGSTPRVRIEPLSGSAFAVRRRPLRTHSYSARFAQVCSGRPALLDRCASPRSARASPRCASQCAQRPLPARRAVRMAAHSSLPRRSSR